MEIGVYSFYTLYTFSLFLFCSTPIYITQVENDAFDSVISNGTCWANTVTVFLYPVGTGQAREDGLFTFFWYEDRHLGVSQYMACAYRYRGFMNYHTGMERSWI